MASLSAVSLPHATIPTQMFGNVNLQNAVMYINENFKAVVDGIKENANAANDALDGKAASDHTHDDAYAAIDHIHQWQDIQGLSAELDGKAELNHEHAQYLSSLPAHYHDVAGIQGLGEALQAKAEKTHQHTMQQVDGLATELGNKASTAYVDQQVANVGESVKPIVEDVVNGSGFAKVAPNTYGSAQEYHTAEELAATHPKDVQPIPANETAEEKQAREIADIGTSAKAARADHQHREKSPTCTTGIASTSGISITPDYADSSSSSASKQTYLNIPAWSPPPKMIGTDAGLTPVGWERGKTAWKNGHDVDEGHPAVGCSIKVCSHSVIRSINGDQRLELFYTNLQFDETGRLIRSIPGCDWFTSPYT